MVDNHFSGLISAEFKELHKDAITALIEGCSVTCTLVYGGSKFDTCTNCVYDPIGKKSANKYLSGGPAPFGVGLCPMCHGSGVIEQEATTSTTALAPIWDSRQWYPMSVTDKITSPRGFVQTISVIANYDEIMEAKHVIINTDETNFRSGRYERFGDPEECGLGASEFILTMWKRMGG